MVYVLVKEWDCADDGYDIVAVFNDRDSLDNYVKKNYPKFTIDEDGDYEYETPASNKFTSKEILRVHEVEVITDRHQ